VAQLDSSGVFQVVIYGRGDELVDGNYNTNVEQAARGWVMVDTYKQDLLNGKTCLVTGGTAGFGNKYFV